MVIVLASHELIDELVGSLYDLVYLLYLLLFYLFVCAIQHLLVLAIFLYWPSQSIAEGVIVGLFDRGIIERESKRLERVDVEGEVDILIGKDGCFLFVQLLLDGLIEGIEFDIPQKLFLVLQIVDDLRESLLAFLQKDADREDKPSAVSIHQVLDDAAHLFLKEELSVFPESGSLQQNLSKCDPIIFLLDFSSALVKIVDIFVGMDEPILEPNLFVLGDDDAGWGESAVNDVVLMQKGDAFDDWSESIENFFFAKMDDVVSSFPIFDLCQEGGLFLSVEKPIIVSDGLEKRGMGDGAFGGNVRVSLEILVGLLGGFVQKKDIVWLEFYYHELFT